MFEYRSIQEYHKALLNGTSTCVGAVQHFIARIKEQWHLNAYVEVYEEEALAKAGALDAERRHNGLQGSLHGVVIGIKDVLCHKDHAVTAASAILKGFTATYDATAVEKLLGENAIIIGRLNCDEFAMGSSNENSSYGKVLNALDETRVPGGSSGGSAVAVQAKLCMVSLGTDTGGSVRQPADFCGVIGLKPTYGRVSRYGLIAYASSFDQIGIFGSTVDDVERVLKVISGTDAYDSTAANLTTLDESPPTVPVQVRKPRIAYFREALSHPGLDPEMASCISAYLEQLTARGYHVEGIDFKYLDYIVPAYYILTTAEASSNLSRYDGIRYGHSASGDGRDLTEFYMESRSEGFGKEVKRRIMLGTFVLSTGYYDAYFSQAQKVRRQLVNTTDLIFNDFDAIVLPTVPSPAFRIGEKTDDPLAMYLADIYTVFANLVGIPAISLPLFTHSNGMPYGLQVMTNRFSELYLLRLSNQLMHQQN